MNDTKVIDLTPQTESYTKKRRKYSAEIKKIQEYYHSKDCKKFDYYKDWKQDWKGFVEYVYPWAGESVLETIVYRLEILRTDLKYFCHHVEGEKMIAEMDEAIEIGHKLLRHDYQEEANKFSDDHVTHYALVYKKLTSNPKDMRTGDLITKIKMPKDDSMNFKHVIDKKHVSPLDKYLKDNNLKEYKDVNVGYTGEWDIESNHDVWVNMIKDATKERNKDLKKFFTILANKLESWGD